MGCGRCVTECPAGVLHFEDVRSRLFGWNITPRMVDRGGGSQRRETSD
jgi:ferredoxin